LAGVWLHEDRKDWTFDAAVLSKTQKQGIVNLLLPAACGKSADLGQLGVDAIVAQTVAAINSATTRR
jgi:hypothetical protein